MAGVVLPVFPMRSFDFSWLVGASSASFVVKRSIDVSKWMSVTLLSRITTSSISNGTIQVGFQLEAPTTDDPALDFVTPLTPFATTTISSLAPTVSVTGATVGVGAFVRVIVIGTRVAAGGSIAAMFSCDLIVRNGI